MAGRITQNSIDEVLQLTDMASLVGEVVKLHGRGSSRKGLCPFHNEKTPSFSINVDQKVYHCFGCRAGGSAVNFVMETQSLGFGEAIEYMAKRAGVQLRYEELSPGEQQRMRRDRDRRSRLLECNEAANRWFVDNLHSRGVGREAKLYANRRRQLSVSTLESFEVGYAPDSWDALSRYLQAQGFEGELIVQAGLAFLNRRGGLTDKFRHRLMYPIRNRLGDLVAFGGRAMGDDDKAAKYLNSPDTWVGVPEKSKSFYKKGDVVFGLDKVRRTVVRQTKGQRKVLLVEGNLDVMTLHQHGFDHAVCASGTKVTETQLGEIARVADEIVLMFDGDQAGRDATREAIPKCIAAGLDGRAVLLPSEIIDGKRKGEDPDSVLVKEGEEAFQRCISAADDLVTVWVGLLLEVAPKTSAGMSALVRQVAAVLGHISDPIRREMVINQVRQLLSDAGFEISGQSIRAAQPSTGRPQRSSRRRDALPRVPELELELVVTALRFPQLLGQVREQQVVLTHAGLKQVIGFMADRASAAPRATALQVTQWLSELTDDTMRSLMLRELAKPSALDGEDGDLATTRRAERHAQHLIDQLELHLQRQVLRVRIDRGLPPAQLRSLQDRIRVLEGRVSQR